MCNWYTRKRTEVMFEVIMAEIVSKLMRYQITIARKSENIKQNNIKTIYT